MLHHLFCIIYAYILQQASEVGTYFIFHYDFSKHEHTHWCSLPCLLLVYKLIAVHLTLAQRVLHPSLTLNVDVRIIVCSHVEKKTKVVYSS